LGCCLCGQAVRGTCAILRAFYGVWAWGRGTPVPLPGARRTTVPGTHAGYLEHASGLARLLPKRAGTTVAVARADAPPMGAGRGLRAPVGVMGPARPLAAVSCPRDRRTKVSSRFLLLWIFF